MASLEYFYGGDIRRTIIHFGRLFMGLQISNGIDIDGEEQLQRVPCRFATSDRQVLQILRNNSENAMLAAPFISYYITNLDIARDRVRNYTSTNDISMAERSYQEGSGYTDRLGNTYQIERMNPSPLDIEFNVDIWTTMVEHKLQLLEQIRLIYNPAITMQTSTSPLDWTAMQEVELRNISFTSRSMPVGTEDSLDIASLTFKVESWISAPAKVTRTKLIETIFTNVGEGSTDEDIFGWDLANISRTVYTPNDAFIRVNETYDEITLLDKWGNPTTTTWEDVFNSYGKYEAGQTQIRLRALVTDEADGTADIYGTVVLDPDNPDILQWTIDVDTLPSTTLTAVDGVINPRTSFPGSSLPAAALGQRYLILQDLGSTGTSTVAWGNLVASNNDIIQYDGANWNVVFDSSENSATQFVGTIAGNKRYQWTAENGWIDPIAGVWRPAWWRIAIND